MIVQYRCSWQRLFSNSALLHIYIYIYIYTLFVCGGVHVGKLSDTMTGLEKNIFLNSQCYKEKGLQISHLFNNII